MKILYNIGIYLLKFGCLAASLFNAKIRTMCSGQRQTFERLSALDKNKKTLWFHCASLGEFEQARNLIETIKERYPNCQILLSFFSPSGYEIRKNYKYADCVVYLPFDTHENARKFVKAANPSMVFFIKYEFWWNYITNLADVPLYSVSLILRKNHYLLKPYSAYFVKLLRNFNMFFVQNKETDEILQSLGYNNKIIAGDTRFDRVMSMSEEKKNFPLIEKFIDGKKSFIAGSSWPEDEKIIHSALASRKDIKIILAPHLIDKNHIDNLLHQFDSSTALSSLTEDNCRNFDVLIIDNIGMLMYLYSLCDIAYIGGGFKEGIHNILEAAVFGKPVAFGPNNKKFQEAQDLIALHAARQINNSEDLKAWTDMLWSKDDVYKEYSSTAKEYVICHTGATEKILKEICLTD